jgi:hypothetical protein
MVGRVAEGVGHDSRACWGSYRHWRRRRYATRGYMGLVAWLVLLLLLWRVGGLLIN